MTKARVIHFDYIKAITKSANGSIVMEFNAVPYFRTASPESIKDWIKYNGCPKGWTLTPQILIRCAHTQFRLQKFLEIVRKESNSYDDRAFWDVEVDKESLRDWLKYFRPRWRSGISAENATYGELK